MAMKQATSASVGDIERLVISWVRHLRAGNRSDATIQTYTGAARQLSWFLTQTGMPTDVASIKREHVEAFIEYLLNNGSRRPPTTATGASNSSSAGWSMRARFRPPPWAS
jgi:hypothetical protein